MTRKEWETCFPSKEARLTIVKEAVQTAQKIYAIHGLGRRFSNRLGRARDLLYLAGFKEREISNLCKAIIESTTVLEVKHYKSDHYVKTKEKLYGPFAYEAAYRKLDKIIKEKGLDNI